MRLACKVLLPALVCLAMGQANAASHLKLSDPIVNNSQTGLWEDEAVVKTTIENSKGPAKYSKGKRQTCLDQKSLEKRETFEEFLSLKNFTCSGDIWADHFFATFTLQCIPKQKAAKLSEMKIRGDFLSQKDNSNLYLTRESIAPDGTKTITRVLIFSKRLGECLAKDATIKATN